MATGSMNLTTWKAKRLVGDSGAAADALIQSGTGVATDIWLFKYNERSLNSGVLYQYTGNNNNDQLKFIDNGITISKSTTTSGDNCAYLRLAVIDTDIGAGYEQGINVLKAYHTHVSTETGMNVVLNSGKNLFIGSGNAADGLYNIRYTASQSLFIASDNNLFIETGASTIANRVGIQMDSSGNIIPVAAEVKNDNVQDLGASDARFKTIYSTTYKAHDLHLYGSAVGNTASDMISGTAGLFSQGDTGPKITFGVYEDVTSGQVGSLIFTDHDYAGVGVSWHFVSNQSDWNVTSKRFHARSSISVGTNLPVTTQALNVSGLAAITNNSNTVTIGSQNADFTHIYNSANIPFIFNKSIYTTSGNLGSATYPWNNLYIGPSNGAGIYYKGTHQTYRMIRFIDNTSDEWGNGISIGGGGLAVFGSGESADTILSNLSLTASGGNETTYIGSDGTIYFFPNQNSWDASAQIEMTAAKLHVGVYRNTTREAQNGARAGAGTLYLYAQAGASANRGLYGANNAGTAASYLYIQQDNYVRAGTRLYGAVWNDYAEFRLGQMNGLKPGQIVTENGDGTMRLASKRLQKGCKVLSDTYGFALGETNEYKLPIAVSGRVLVYCDTPIEELEPGDCLCSNVTGNAIKMTQEEIIKYPDRIIGTVSEIPTYEIWHCGDQTNEDGMKEEVIVNGRIWIYVK